MSLSKFFFNQPEESYLADIFEKFRKEGLQQAMLLQSLLGGVLIVWCFFFASSNVLYYVVLSIFFTLLGIGGYLLLRGGAYTCAYSYGLLAAGALLLSTGLFYQPGAAQAPQAELIVYYFVLLGLAALSFSGEITISLTVFSLVAWTIGCIATSAAGTTLPPLSELAAAAGALLIGGTLLSVVLWRMRYFMYKQINAEHEYYSLLSQKEQYDDLQEEYIDPVTGLGTRTAFERDSTLFTKVFAEGRLSDLTIAFIDVENPKGLAKEYGKGGYQKLLRVFAEAARKRFRSSDMVYRFSTDQFVLLAPGSSISNAARLEGLLSDIVEKVKEAGFSEFKAGMGISTLGEVKKMTETQTDATASAG